MSKIGKRVVDDLYVHLSALDYLEDLEQRRRIEAALQHCAGGQPAGVLSRPGPASRVI
jgi:hypothetical protein